MAMLEPTTKFAEKNHLDRTLDRILANLDKDEPITASHLGQITVAAQVQTGLDRYRAGVSRMSTRALEVERHDSARLGQHLVEKFGPRPPRCHAHAIVAGKQTYAAELRLAMAMLKIRIDDVVNGCWLPENTAATPHPAFPSAPPHSRIHRSNYYFWISTQLAPFVRNKGMFEMRLKLIARMLYTGKFPKYVMLPKGQGL